MPFIVSELANTPESLEDSIAMLEMVPRNCRLDAYKKLKNIPEFMITGECITYASPDSTYAVTHRLLTSAENEIVMGIYDFSADYMKELILQALHRGVKVSLMLDIDSKKEEDLFKELKKFGCKAVPAPSCASDNVSYFPSSHEKVIVIDGTWTLVQSGNWSENSIPFNEEDGGDPDHFVRGNRDMGVAVKSKELAAFYSKVLRSDMKLELDAAGTEALPSRVAGHDLVESVPELLPSKLFPSKSFDLSGVKVTPVLTPDNYMDVIPEFLESADESILIEQQYIRSQQPDVVQLLEAIAKARSRNSKLDIRIILGKLFGSKDYEKEQKNIANLKKVFKLILGNNIRYIDTKRFVHCHNKLIIVDEKSALVSSQNWSNTGVNSNREAGLIIPHSGIAKYFTLIFESDWKTAQTKIPKPGKRTIGPEALSTGKFVTVRAADYQEV